MYRIEKGIHDWKKQTYSVASINEHFFALFVRFVKIWTEYKLKEIKNARRYTAGHAYIDLRISKTLPSSVGKKEIPRALR